MIYYLIVLTFTFGFSLLLGLGIIFYKPDISKSGLSNLHLKLGKRIIWWPVSIYFLVFSCLSILKYNAFNMAMVDLGRMSQAIWNTAQGRFLTGTFEFGTACRMIAHSELIYLLIAPFYMIYPDPKVLLVLQSLIIAIGFFPVYWLARKKLGGNFTPFCFSLAYLLYSPLQYGNLADFHPDMLATVFLLFAFYYLVCKNWLKYFIFLLLSLACKEYVSLILIMLGVYVLFSEKNIRIGSVTLISGILWFFITYKFIPAFLLSGKENMTIGFYNHLGRDINEVSLAIIFHPLTAIAKTVTFEKLGNLLLLLLPVGFLSLLSLSTLLIALPVFLGVILTPFFSYANHHNGTIIPFIFISAILGTQYLINKFNSKLKNMSYALGIFVLSSSFISNVLFGPSPLSWRFWDVRSYRYWDSIQQFKITEHDKIANRLINMIPPKAAVSASNHLASHLSQREVIYHFPYPADFNQVDYILVDLLEYFPPDWNPRSKDIDALRGLILGERFSLIASEDGILLFKKTGKNNDFFQLKAAWVKEISPHYRIDLSFGARLKLIGYDLEDRSLKRGTRYRIVYYWQVLGGFKANFPYTCFNLRERLSTEYLLIDRLANRVREFRIVHLPLYILYTPEQWEEGEIIKEEYDFILPEDMPKGTYAWSVGLYAAPKSFFIQTGAKGFVPGTKEISLGTLELK